MRICTKFPVEMGSGEIGWAVDVAQRRRVDGDVAGAEGFERLVQRAHADAEQRLELADRPDRPAGEARMPAPGDGDDRPGPAATACTASTVRSGRSHAATTTAPTPPPANQRTASMTPPSGPSPGHVSARTSRPVAAVSRDRSPPTSTTGAQPAASSTVHTCSTIDLADLDQGLVAPHPPARAAAQHGAARARRLGRQDGGPVGSSWSRNCSQRAASSCSPISAAVRCRPQAAQEADVGRLRPAHVAGSPPAVRPQRAEAAV